MKGSSPAFGLIAVMDPASQTRCPAAGAPGHSSHNPYTHLGEARRRERLFNEGIHGSESGVE